MVQSAMAGKFDKFNKKKKVSMLYFSEAEIVFCLTVLRICVILYSRKS